MKEFRLLNYIEIISVLVVGTMLYSYFPTIYLISSIAMTALIILYIFAVFVYVKIAHIKNPLYSPMMCLYLACIMVSTWLPVLIDKFSTM